MFRLITAASTAAMVIGGASARLTADQVLKFNLTFLPSQGIFDWNPVAELDAPGLGAAAWVATYPDQVGQNWSSSARATGTPLYSSNQTFILPNAPPQMWINAPAEAFYLKGSWAPVNGSDNNALRTYDPDAKLDNSDPVARLSADGYIRYLDGMDPFTYRNVGFGVPVGYQGGGNFTVESVVATMSAVTRAPTFQEFWDRRDERFVYQQGNRNFDSYISCTSDVTMREDVEGSDGGGYVNARWFANNTAANCVITLPSNTSMFYLNGTTGYYYDNMMVEWDPPLPDGMNLRTQVNDITTHTKYIRRRELLHVQTLDPRVQYKVTVKAKGNYTGQAFVSIHSFTFFSAYWNGQQPTYDNDTSNNPESTTAPRKSSNTGAIVGGAIGGVLGALCVGGLAFWLWLQHRRKNRSSVNGISKEANSNFDINDPNVTPFMNRSGSRTSTGDNAMSEVPSSPDFSRSRGNTGTLDSESNLWSDEDLLSPSSAAGYGSLSSMSTSKSPAPSSTGGSNRPIRPPMPRREVISEMDAGTLEPIVDSVVEYEYVPPQYNPEWAQRSTDGSTGALSTGAPSDSGRRSTMGASTLGAHRSDTYDTATSGGETPMFEETDPMSPSTTTFSGRYSSTLSPTTENRPRSP